MDIRATRRSHFFLFYLLLLLVSGFSLVTPAHSPPKRKEIRQPEGGAGLVLALAIDSIRPFTTVSRPAPATIRLPRNTSITVSASSNVDVQDFVWSGADELSQGPRSSVAVASFQTAGLHTVTVTPDARSTAARSIDIEVTDVAASSVVIAMREATNAVRVAPIGEVFDCHAETIPAGYEHLIEWTGGGTPVSGLGPAFSTRYDVKGRYTIRAGSQRGTAGERRGRAPSALTIDIYSVVAVSRDSAFGPTVWYGYPITFTATTDPPGFEANVTWIVNTMGDMNSHAEPAGGTGASFTTTFTNPPEDSHFWAQVYADGFPALENTDPPLPIPAPSAQARYTQEPASGTNPPEDGPGDGTGQPPPSGESPKDAEDDGGPGVGSHGEPGPGGSCAYVRGEPVCGGSTPKDNDKGDDVYLNNGEFYVTLRDFWIPGRGFSYRFERCYKSGVEYGGPLGHNWDHNYNARLVKHRTTAGQLTGHMLLASGSCRQDLYVRNTDGTFRAPRGHYTKLTRNADGSFLLRQRDGMKYHFVPLGLSDRLFLSSITDRRGNVMSFRYDSRGLLRTVTDTLGRGITYDYDGSDRLIAVTDFHARSLSFAYDVKGDLDTVRSFSATGTPNGNDFPSGKMTRYTYSSGFAESRLNHNLLTMTHPNETALDPDGPPVLVNGYGTDPSRPYELDKVLTQTYGGVNAASAARGLAPAGGRFTYFYQQLNPAADPADLTLPRNRTTVVDRVGNVAEYEQNILGLHIRYREYTGRVDPALSRATLQTLIPSANPGFPPIARLRSADPAVFETRYEYNVEGELTRAVHPEGNSDVAVYDRTHPDRFQQGNLLELRQVPGPRGADGIGGAISDIVTRLVYEPIFNQPRLDTDPRGLDPGFVPPVDPADSLVTGIDFDGDGATTAQEKRRARYTSQNVFDYQEGTFTDILNLAQAEGVPLTAAAAVALSLNADVNGDALTSQRQGNVVLVRAPTVILDSGGTQPIATRYGYNSRGQMLFRIDPDGSRDDYRYYPQSNPHGAGGTTPDADTPGELGGYVGRRIADTTTTDNADGVALGITTENRYDPVGNLISVLDGRGVRTDYVVNQRNQVVRVVHAANVDASPEPGLQPFAYTVDATYDANDNVVRIDVQNRDGATDANAFLTTTISYDILDNPIETIQEVSPVKTVATSQRYDANDNLIRVIEPIGNFHDTAYDERDLALVATIGADSPAMASTQLFTYDGNRNVRVRRDAEDTDAVGGAEEATRILDGFDRIVQMLDPVGNQEIRTYDPASNLIAQTQRGRVAGPTPTTNATVGNVDLARTHVDYDELCRRTRTVDDWFVPSGVVLTRPPLPGDGSDVTRAEYDAAGRLILEINDNGHGTTYSYDGVDRVLRVVDSLQNETLSEYDDNHNLTRVTVVERRGDAPGTSPETFVTSYRYDALNRLRLESDNLGQTRRYSYDSRGNLAQFSDAQGPVDWTDPELGLLNRSGNTIRFFHDGLSRLTKVVEDLRTGGVGSGTPPLDGPADPNLDPPDLDTTDPANPDGKVVELATWDDNSRLDRVTDDRGNATVYQYDSLNRRTLETFADSTTRFIQYDRDNNVRQITDQNGSVFLFDHDGINRPIATSITRAAGIAGTTTQTFEYDGLTRPTRLTDNNDPASGTDDSVVTLAYDSLSPVLIDDSLARVLEENQDGHVVTRDHDGFGNRLRLIYPDGRSVESEFDALERSTVIRDQQIGLPIATYAYVGPRRVLERTFRNGTKLTYVNNAGAAVGYDGVKRIARHRHETSTDGTIAEFTYGYNREGHRLFERRLHQPVGANAKGEAYTYDSLYRLTAFRVGSQTPAGGIAVPDTSTAYHLDGVGNRASMVKDAVTTNYTRNVMNEYDTVGGAPNLHDDNGNLKDDGTFTFVHDALNRLVRVIRKADGLSVAVYTYDAFNRRVTKSVTHSGAWNGVTRFVWDGWREIEERNGSGAVLAQYVYGPAMDELLTMDRGGTTYYYHDDSLGSVEALTDGTQAIVERTVYDAYGAPQFADAAFTPTGTASSVGNPFLFTAQRFDPETGLYYYRNRYYSPSTGRFIERDPMSYAGGSMGLYEYVRSDPANGIDPLGLELSVAGDISAIGGSDKKAREDMEKELQKLDPSATVDKKTGKVTQDPKVNTKGHEQGAALIKKLIENKKRVLIKVGNVDSKAKPLGPDASKPGKGSDVDVYVNPKATDSNGKPVKVPTLKVGTLGVFGIPYVRVTKQKSDLSIILGHELIHAWHLKEGMFASMTPEQYKDLFGKKRQAPPEEQETVGLGKNAKKHDITENCLRKEQGLPPRVAY